MTIEWVCLLQKEQTEQTKENEFYALKLNGLESVKGHHVSVLLKQAIP